MLPCKSQEQLTAVKDGEAGFGCRDLTSSYHDQILSSKGEIIKGLNALKNVFRPGTMKEKRSRMIAPEKRSAICIQFLLFAIVLLPLFRSAGNFAMFSLAQYLHSNFEASKPVLGVLFVNGEERCAVAGWWSLKLRIMHS
jgi:hypothetical protein